MHIFNVITSFDATSICFWKKKSWWVLSSGKSWKVYPPARISSMRQFFLRVHVKWKVLPEKAWRALNSNECAWIPRACTPCSKWAAWMTRVEWEEWGCCVFLVMHLLARRSVSRSTGSLLTEPVFRRGWIWVRVDRIYSSSVVKSCARMSAGENIHFN